MTLEELKKEFKTQGFRIEGNSFVHEFEDPNTIINGIHPKKRFGWKPFFMHQSFTWLGLVRFISLPPMQCGL